MWDDQRGTPIAVSIRAHGAYPVLRWVRRQPWPLRRADAQLNSDHARCASTPPLRCDTGLTLTEFGLATKKKCIQRRANKSPRLRALRTGSSGVASTTCPHRRLKSMRRHSCMYPWHLHRRCRTSPHGAAAAATCAAPTSGSTTTFIGQWPRGKPRRQKFH